MAQAHRTQAANRREALAKLASRVREAWEPPKVRKQRVADIKFSPDGGSFAFYPNGRMAVAFEKMGAGYYVFFYADNAEGTTLCAFDPFGCGYAAFANGKPRLTSRKQGGVYIDQPTGGKIAKSWSTSKPKLRNPFNVWLCFANASFRIFRASSSETPCFSIK